MERRAHTHTHTHTHLFVALLLSSLLQSESSQLIGSLLHQVDITDGIWQGFDDVWGAGRKQSSLFCNRSTSLNLQCFSSTFWTCSNATYLQTCLGRSPLLLHTQTEQAKSVPGSSHSLDWCSDSLQGESQIEGPSVQKHQHKSSVLCCLCPLSK